MHKNSHRKRLLIIEDDVNLLYSLQAKFSMKDFSVQIHQGNSSIEEILQRIELYVPHYIILDLVLPQVDGFEFLKSLKAKKETSSIPVFIFTNLSDKDSKARSEKLGAEYYFIKSDFVLDEFVEKVLKIIENREGANK